MLGISGENAILLLHKTQSAKSLGNLDDLFRSFMLDHPCTFDLAENAVTQFAELSEAHRLVVEARAQVEHLRRLEDPARSFEASDTRAREVTGLHEALNGFTGEWKLELAQTAQAQEEAGVLAARHGVERAAERVRELDQAHAAARRQVEDRGGSALKQQHEWVSLAEEQERSVKAQLAEVATRLAAVGIGTVPESFGEFTELRSTARQARAALQSTKQEADTTRLGLYEKLSEARGAVRSLEQELTSLRGRRSNLPDALIRAREQVATQAGLPAVALPYAGELLEVRKEFADWTGAIERVLRPLATVMLVSEVHVAAVREAVDGLTGEDPPDEWRPRG